jgi:hypothetical protein
LKTFSLGFSGLLVSLKMISTPLLRNASSRRRWITVSALNSISSKICGSGLKRMRVPFFLLAPSSSSGDVACPREYVWR